MLGLCGKVVLTMSGTSLLVELYIQVIANALTLSCVTVMNGKVSFKLANVCHKVTDTL